MSEHTPLTEAEREAVETYSNGSYSCDCRREVCRRVPCVNGREDALTVAARIKADAYAAGLAARTSTATADTGLRERVEALADEWETTVYKLPPGYPMTVNEFCRLWFKAPLRAILDATPASTEDRADNEGTR